jgi:hypothetical protein
MEMVRHVLDNVSAGRDGSTNQALHRRAKSLRRARQQVHGTHDEVRVGVRPTSVPLPTLRQLLCQRRSLKHPHAFFVHHRTIRETPVAHSDEDRRKTFHQCELFWVRV